MAAFGTKNVQSVQCWSDYLCYVATLTEKMDTAIRSTMDSKCAVLVELVPCVLYEH